MRILHLSDTHLYGDPSARHYDRIDPTAAFTAVLDRLRDVRDIDAVVHAGDASEDGSVASYELLLSMLRPFAEERGAVLAVVMGNHDAPSAFAEVAGPGDHAGVRADGTGYQDRVVAVPDGARVVVLDTSVPRAGYGHLDEVQISWLREVLAEPAGGVGTVLALHHPPLPAATELQRALELDELDVLADAVRGSDVRVILSGHYHHAMSGELAGIPVLVAPGITNVADPLTPGGRNQAYALSGASLVEVAAEGAAHGVTVSTSVWPSGGDGTQAPWVPVHDFSPEFVQRIIAAAGRPH